MFRIREITAFFKKEAVLCIAVILAVISMFFVPPDGKYIAFVVSTADKADNKYAPWYFHEREYGAL